MATSSEKLADLWEHGLPHLLEDVKGTPMGAVVAMVRPFLEPRVQDWLALPPDELDERLERYARVLLELRSDRAAQPLPSPPIAATATTAQA